MEKDLKWIKKHYGEEMMHLCREMFPKLLETEGVLPDLLDTHFARNRHLAEDIKKENKQFDFKDYIFSLVDVEKKKANTTNKKSASELLDEAGYILYPECETEEDIQAFKKYYSKGEELCTFRGGRLNSCRVWFAVKKDVDKIKREDFIEPHRQDKYGTSVISIQFAKHNSTLSIKNRYNHTVNNPDNTFNSDLDLIISGLTDAFEKDFGVRDLQTQTGRFELDNYIKIDGKYYHYNLEINNKYYCDNNIIIDHFTVSQLPESQMLVDYFIVDFKNKKISLYDKYIVDCFPVMFTNIDKINYNNDILTITHKDNTTTEIGINDRRQMVSLSNENLKDCGHNFLYFNKHLKELNLPALEECGYDFLFHNMQLEELNLPTLRSCGSDFLTHNNTLNELNLPALQSCGNDFLSGNECLTELNLPALEECRNHFLLENSILNKLNLPKLKKCGYGFLYCNKCLTELNLPALEECENSFLPENSILNKLNLPKLKKCEGDFLCRNECLTELNLPALEECKNDFLLKNSILNKLNLPKLQSCGNNFLLGNEQLEELNLPALKNYGRRFMWSNKKIKDLETLFPKKDDDGISF